ncbi:putative DNA-binding protein [Mycobacteroides abscessus subsp. abscessus]|uniref:ESX secretion-associated protein EspG n=1 Tax=Mycobacteroides abscessus TaxID=36809 RepID=UPI0009275473|nr:ESX secretion-associated protein EspG [Mycobacteroides abscessus]SIJ22137.1 putative DNA-binding protein [Mycobacteroides abscessus subsp. abscessus]SLH38541.1 putative DNA-binding protein [Mycobacteroides abscessus subsp. abscessus]
MTSPNALEVTAFEAWFLSDYLHAGEYPWSLAITAPYFDPAQRDSFNSLCLESLSSPDREYPVIDSHGEVIPEVAAWVRSACYRRQWLEWKTYSSRDENLMLRSVAARVDHDPNHVVVVQRNAQMVTFTYMDVPYTEALVPIVTCGLQDQNPAWFDEFEIPMDIGVEMDQRISKGANIVDSLLELDLGIDEQAAQVMELAWLGERMTVELTAHDAIDGAHHDTDVSVNITNTEIGRVLAATPPGERREGGKSVFSPAEPFAIAVAIRDLTARLPSGPWFPNENLTM